ncbi:hypothetical protein HDV00_012384 [Rhizophlyctis rosea]|nr:hypothetical protein HDV00_012384 [Rhizophlyctis rosea]
MKLYRINVAGTLFHLSKRNMETDSPNILTSHFERHRVSGMHVDRDPVTFRIIATYLRGYDITRYVTSHNLPDLILDAQHYQLNHLLQLLQDIQNKQNLLCKAPHDALEMEPLLKSQPSSISGDADSDTASIISQPRFDQV